MKWLIALLAVFGLAANASAAITFDTEDYATATGVVSVQLTHTSGVCANEILLADVVNFIASGQDATGVTATAGAMTKKTGALDDSGNKTSEMFYRVMGNSPAAQTVTATVPSSAFEVSLSTRSYCGVDQTTPTGGAAVYTAGSTNHFDITTASDVGELVVDLASTFSDDDNTLTVDPGQSEEANHIGTYIVLASSDKAGAASVTTGWTQVTANYVLLLAYPLKPAGAPPTTAVPRRTIFVE